LLVDQFFGPQIMIIAGGSAVVLCFSAFAAAAVSQIKSIPIKIQSINAA
jgi:hypothetical protein